MSSLVAELRDEGPPKLQSRRFAKQTFCQLKAKCHRGAGALAGYELSIDHYSLIRSFLRVLS